MTDKKILVLGATGMLGHILFSQLSELEDSDVYATARLTEGLKQWFAPELLTRIMGPADADDFASILRVLDEVAPEVVINCIGIIKQLPEARDPVTSISINALFPHKLAQACRNIGARMIHISTDCVFSGNRGNYIEEDRPDAADLYGRTKLLGEVDYAHCVTLRTSMIGHELKGKYGLIEWFLGQEETVKGFAKAIFSGFPTIEMANIICHYVLPNKGLSGLYHVSSDPISKYDLLREVARCYSRKIEIEKDEDLRCDRSLDSSRFRKATRYKPPSWHELIANMYKHYISATYYRKQ